MPSELRKIIFERRELYDAIVSHNKFSKNKLPPGELQLVEVGQDNEVYALFHIINLATGEAQQKRLGASHIAAAMLTYCKAKKIPVPRSFRKSLSYHDGEVALLVTNSPRHAAADSGAAKEPKQAA